jgi:hypothetical protein
MSIEDEAIELNKFIEVVLVGEVFVMEEWMIINVRIKL